MQKSANISCANFAPKTLYKWYKDSSTFVFTMSAIIGIKILATAVFEEISVARETTVAIITEEVHSGICSKVDNLRANHTENPET